METLGARPAGVHAGIGPAIGPDRYQVGTEVADAARDAFGPRPFLSPDSTGAWLFDLWAANRFLLREAGVPDRNIHVADVPTGPEPGLFFSDRTARPCGRFAALARLRPQDGGAR
jgi:copper oxidase (laccase) domain-containing protein